MQLRSPYALFACTPTDIMYLIVLDLSLRPMLRVSQKSKLLEKKVKLGKVFDRQSRFEVSYYLQINQIKSKNALPKNI